MKIGSVLLGFAFFGLLSSAHADVIFSGSVATYPYFTSGTAGTPCSHSETSYGSISLHCNNAEPVVATASVTGSGDAFSGFLNADTTAAAYAADGMAAATAIGELDLKQTYVLLGAFGQGSVDIAFVSPTYFQLNSGQLDCTVTFDGASQPCDLLDGEMSFPVYYFLPFSLGLEVSAFENNGFDGAEINDILNYSIHGSGLLFAIPTPEPSSGLLLLPGLLGVISLRKRALGRRRS